MDRSAEDRAIRQVVDRLAERFPEVDTAEIAQAVDESRPEFDGSPIRDFVPLFVERSARHRLRQRVG
jgi:hypothetical protein